MAAIPKVGENVRGKYRLDGVLGEGGMSVVFRADNLKGPGPVALKILRPEMLDAPDTVARFERETRAARQLNGPHVARVIDVDQTIDGLPFMVMELLEGHDLAEEVDLRGALPIDEAVDYVVQACGAMEEAHGLGIVHRDLKPSNLYLSDTTGERTIKVLDFGISKVIGDDDVRVTRGDTSLGTPLYMSPEQVRASKDVDLRTDVWSLGVILYQLLVGRPPFAGSTTTAAAMILAQDPDPPRTLRPEIPEGLEAVLKKALAKEPDARWPDTRAFAQALAPFAPAAPIAGERLAQIHREANANRLVRMAPSTSTSPTLIRANRAPAAPSQPAPPLPEKPERSPFFWVAVGVLLGLPVAAAIAYFALR